jgi:hypothetical protein
VKTHLQLNNNNNNNKNMELLLETFVVMVNIESNTKRIKVHNEELHNLYSSPSIIRKINSRRMRWAGHVA